MVLTLQSKAHTMEDGPNGTSANGTRANDTSANDTSANDTSANGTSANDTSANGTSPYLKVYKHFTSKEMKGIHSDTKYCDGCSEKGVPCKKKASYWLESNNTWYCGLHNKPRRVKNSLYDRKGSFHYSASLSIHSSHPLLEDVSTTSREECFYCKKSLVDQHKCMDHIESVIKDGKPNTKYVNSVYNKVLCCTHCNTSKGNTDPIEWATRKNLSEATVWDIKTRMEKIPTFNQNEVRENLKKYKIAKDLYDIIIFVCTSEVGYVDMLKNKLLMLICEVDS